jgi:hypothetical protein
MRLARDLFDDRALVIRSTFTQRALNRVPEIVVRVFADLPKVEKEAVLTFCRRGTRSEVLERARTKVRVAIVRELPQLEGRERIFARGEQESSLDPKAPPPPGTLYGFGRGGGPVSF